MAVPGNAGGRTPYDYSIEAASITNDATEEKFEVGPAIAELILFEHINKPFISGKLVLVDTVDLYNRINLRGTDTFEVKIYYPGTEKRYTKKFVITAIEGSKKTNDTTDVIILRLVEYDFFKSRTQTISKAYFDTADRILESVLTDGEIDKEVECEYPPVQERFRYIAPYINPFAICAQIRQVSTTERGYPYFFYSTLNSENKLMFRNLKELLQRPPTVSSENPYTYSSVATQRQELATNIDAASRVIEGYKVVHDGDLLSLVTQGFISSTLESVNVNQFEAREYEFDITEILDDVAELYPVGQRASFYDEEFMGGLHTKKTRRITNLAASNIYSDGEAGIHEISTWDDPTKIFTREALLAFFPFSSIDVRLPGYQFFSENEEERTIGSNINLRFYNNDARNITNDNRSEDEVIDTKKSGQYLIMATRHTFSQSRYYVSATCVKFTDLEETE